MISQLSIRNYQSLYEVDLELAPYTVIVGASSSGKSAFTRAIKTLTSNSRGASFISTGELVATIKAVTDNGTVSLKRGHKPSDNEYRIIPSDPALPHPAPFTKLGGEVPDEVSQFIGIPAKDAINYAGQFDKPFLLDDSANEVARTLGALTNVNIIFESARESNRRKLSAAATHKTRAADLANIKIQAEGFRGLQDQLSSIANAEALIEVARGSQQSIDRIEALMDIIAICDITLDRTAATSPPPSDHDIISSSQAVTRFQTLIAQWSSCNALVKSAEQQIEAFTLEQEHLEQQYLDTLHQLGECPTCHQSTRGV